MYVVGIYTGEDLLGEGFGSSLKMAEFRVRLFTSPSITSATNPPNQAAEDALHRLYLTRTPSEHTQLPTSTFLGNDIFSMESESEGEYTPGILGEAEVTYGISGRSGVVLPGSGSRVEVEVGGE